MPDDATEGVAEHSSRLQPPINLYARGCPGFTEYFSLYNNFQMLIYTGLSIVQIRRFPAKLFGYCLLGRNTASRLLSRDSWVSPEITENVYITCEDIMWMNMKRILSLSELVH